MQNLWSDEEALLFPGDLGQRVYSSRLLGRNKSLVLHGGGNTSVKIREQGITGELEDILYVKGSGRDLEHIDADGFSPVRLHHLIKLSTLESLSDPDMLNEMVTNMTRAGAPSPSVEAILHAIIPAQYVDHTHADAVLSITNTKDYEQYLASIYGDTVLVIPYVMPGFSLSRLCAGILPEATDKTIGMVLVKHGIFSFGGNARESYDRMIRLVGSAEHFLEQKRAWNIRSSSIGGPPAGLDAKLGGISGLRKAISNAAGKPMILRLRSNENIRRFIRRADLQKISQQGPPTPDHVIRTKRVPMIGRDVSAYAQTYARYFDENVHRKEALLRSLDPAPRVVLDAELGLCTLGQTVRDADIVGDLYEHTIDIIERSEVLGGYVALPASDLFDVEYWDLEQAKLRRGGTTPPHTGEIAVVTGAASGIGKACAESLLARGAAVVGLDVDPVILAQPERSEFLGIVCDVTAPDQVKAALERAALTFGGVDILILNAGVFPLGADISSLGEDAWRRVMQVNLDANLTLLRESHALLRDSPRGGRVVIIGSKNVSAPSPGVAAYSASKAALSQLGRVAALEWAKDNIRVNQIHPDGVFDTGIWTPDVLAHRAESHSMSVDEYRKRNLLATEITSSDVGEMAADLCGPTFSKITGAHIPMDGGSDRVI